MTAYSCEQLMTSTTFYLGGSTIAPYNTILPVLASGLYDGQGVIVDYSTFAIPLTSYRSGHGIIASYSTFSTTDATNWYSQGILGGVNQTYAMRGRYVAGGVYEYWTGSTPTTLPPSGHSLANITVIAIY